MFLCAFCKTFCQTNISELKTNVYITFIKSQVYKCQAVISRDGRDESGWTMLLYLLSLF